MSSGTPIIVNKTGGMQDQITDGETVFGVGIEPCSKAVIGSQQVPYIYEDRISKEDFVDALVKMYEMSESDRKELGAQARQWSLDGFGFDTMIEKWDEVLTGVYEKYGSWDTRQNYKSYRFGEIK